MNSEQSEGLMLSSLSEAKDLLLLSSLRLGSHSASEYFRVQRRIYSGSSLP